MNQALPDAAALPDQSLPPYDETHVVEMSFVEDSPYTLRLHFTDSTGSLGTRCFDVTPWLDRGVFRALRDDAYFRRARLAYGTVEWPDGQDFDPVALYVHSTPCE